VTLDHGTPTVAVKIQGTERILIVNSGYSCSLLQPVVADVPLESITLELFGVTGDCLDIVGNKKFNFKWVESPSIIHFWFANCQHLRMVLLD
jgi:hypothetical protein